MLLTKDRIKELTTTSGTGTLTLSGTAEQGFQAFSVLGNGTKCYYAITDVNGTDFEVGLGTYNSNTLTRDTILESSNSGNAISLSATGSTVFVSYPAEKSSYRDIGVNRDYTASGSITAGKPLILNTDNTVTQVAQSTVTDASPTLSAVVEDTAVYCQTSHISTKSITYEPYSGAFVKVTSDTSNSDYVTIQAGTLSSGVVTWGTAVVVNSYYSSFPSITSGENQVVFSWHTYTNPNAGGNGYQYWLRTATISGTTISLGTQGNFQAIGGGVTDRRENASICYDSNAQRIMYSYNLYDNPNGELYIATAQFNTGLGGVSNASTPQKIDDVYTAGNLPPNSILVYDENAQRVVILYNKQYDANTGYPACRVLQINNNTTTIGAVTTVVSSTYNLNLQTQVNGVYDPTNQKVVFIFTQDSPNRPYYFIATTTGGSTNTVATTTPVIIVDREIKYGIFYDTDKSRINIIVNQGSHPNRNIGVRVYSSNGSTLTLDTTASSSSTAEMYGGQIGSAYKSGSGAVYYTTINGSNAMAQVTSVYNSVTSSNLTTDNYFGIASTTASDTEAVGVNRAGSFNNDQTGLTAGKDYYAKNDGTIVERTTTTTTPDTNPTISTITKQTGSTYSYWDNSIAYESTSGYYVRGRREGSTNYPVVESGTWGSLTAGITWNTPTVLSSNSLRGNRIRVATGGGYAHCSYCTRENSNENAKVTPVSISGSGSLTLGTTTTVNTLATSGSNTQPTSIVYDTSQNTILAFFDLGWQSGYLHKVFPLQMSGANYSYNSSDAVTFASGIDMSAKSTNAIYDPDTNRTVFFYILDAGTRTVNGIVFSCSGTTITQGSTQTASFTGTPNSGAYLSLAYDTQNNKIIIMYDHNTGAPNYTSYLPKYSIVTVTGGGTNTLSYTADAYAFSDNTQRTQVISLAWNGDANKLFMVYGAYGDSHTQCDTFTSNGSTLTSTSSEELTTDQMVDSGGNETNGAVFVTDKGVSYSLGNGAPGIMNFTLSLGSSSSTTVNASQFVGTARSGTDLELSDTPLELVGLANGSITKGKPVILRTDGDFEEVKNSITSISYSNGTESEITSGWLDMHSLSYDTVQGRFLAVYRDQDASNYGYYRTFKVSSNTISDIVSGSSFNTNSTTILDSVYIGNSKHVVLYTNSSNYLYGRVIVMASDGTCTEGTATALYTGNTHHKATCYYESTTGTVVWLGSFYYNSQKAQAVGIYVDGTNLTVGSFVDNPNNYTQCSYFSSSYDEEAQIGIVAYEDGGSNSIFNTISVTGTNTVSWNTDVVFNGSNRCKLSADGMTYDPKNKKHLCLFNDNGNSDDLYGIVATVSGTTVTHGTKALVTTESNDIPFGCQGTDGGGISYAFRDDGSPYYLKGGVITISGTSFTLSNSTTYNSTALGSNNCVSFAYQPSDYTTVAMYEENTGHDLQAVAIVPEGSITVPNLTATNFIGFAKNTVADNEDVKVATTGQTDDNQSSLTIASQYYVQNDATLSTTAGTPSVLGGTALSSTKILIKS